MLIDILFIVIIIMAILRGMSTGLIAGIISFFAIMIGLAAALKLSVVMAGYLQNSVLGATRWLPLISFILVLILVLLITGLLARVIKKAIQFAMLGWLDSLGGIALYIFIYTIIFSIFLFYADKLLLLSPEVISNSKTYPYIAPWGPKVMNSMGKIIPLFKNMFADLESFFAGLSNKIAK